MCIVIDINSLAHVFNKSSNKHQDFKPVHDWVTAGEGHIVYGGTRYKQELIRTNKYLRLFRLLKDARRAYEIDKFKVDTEDVRVQKATKGTGCNDQHIIAIFIVSGCRLFCSEDTHADKYITDKSLYPKRHPRPLIYRNLKHRHLLCRKFIVPLRNIT